jgi:hypothetical protein
MSIATVKPKYQVGITTGDLEAIMREHRIPAREWGQWSALVFEGKRPSATLFPRIRRGNRGCAFKAILTAISERYFEEKNIRFPPPDWQPTKAQLARVYA